MDQIKFRKMELQDVDKVVEIENSSFAVPWTRESFQNEMFLNRFAIYTIAELNGEIIGYCGMWLVIDESQITNIALLPEYRGKGYGEQLLRYVMNLAREKGAVVMTLEVRVSNSSAQSLYRKLGFQDGGIRKNYYSDNQEDALVMWVNLNE
ncbi:MAG TPA: ribosomal protein S18-alanine N-acetyltransferase [Chondromyces sp.]|nr:ribosomal protein S18-alanine N-acetyltransferase [Chondromyces sp.]